MFALSFSILIHMIVLYLQCCCVLFFRKNRRNASEPTATWESRERAERCCGCNWRRGWVRLPSRAYMFVQALRFNNILYVRCLFSDPKPNAHADVLVSGAVTKVKPLLLTLLIMLQSLLRYEVGVTRSTAYRVTSCGVVWRQRRPTVTSVFGERWTNILPS